MLARSRKWAGQASRMANCCDWPSVSSTSSLPSIAIFHFSKTPLNSRSRSSSWPPRVISVPDLQPLVGDVLAIVSTVAMGQVVKVGTYGRRTADSSGRFSSVLNRTPQSSGTAPGARAQVRRHRRWPRVVLSREVRAVTSAALRDPISASSRRRSDGVMVRTRSAVASDKAARDRSVLSSGRQQRRYPGAHRRQGRLASLGPFGLRPLTPACAGKTWRLSPASPEAGASMTPPKRVGRAPSMKPASP